MPVNKLTHVARYGKPRSGDSVELEVAEEPFVVVKGKRFDVRAGKEVGRDPGVAFSRDGRKIVREDDALVLVAKGKRVPIDTRSTNVIRFVGERLLVQREADYTKPLVVIGADGKVVGPVKGQKRDGNGLYYPFLDSIGDRIWMLQTTSIARVDMDALALVDVVELPRGHLGLGLAVLEGERFATYLRTKKMHAELDSSKDVLVVVDRKGRELARRAGGDSLCLTSLGDRIVVLEGDEIVLLDRKLEEIDRARVPKPAKPEGLERLWGDDFVVTGENNVWDHYRAPRSD